MKRDSLLNALIAIVLASVIAISGIGCLTSAFHLRVSDWTHLICLSVFFAIVCAVCFNLRWGTLALTLLSLLAVALLLRYGDLLISLEKLLNHITKLYSSGYGWPYVRWSEKNLARVLPDTALTVSACLVIMAVCWTVCRRKWFGFGAIAGLLPLLCCCVVLDTIPDDTYLFLLLTALLLLTLTQRLRNISLRDANRLTACLLIPVILLSTVLFRYSSEDTYKAQAQAAQNTLFRWAAWLTDHGFIPGGNIPIPGTQGTGVVDSVNLSAAGPIELGDAPVMYLTSNSTRGVFYLRGRSYNTYTGTQWDSTLDTADENGWPTAKLQIKDSIHVRTGHPLGIWYFSYYLSDKDWTQQLKDGALPNPGYLTEYTLRVASLVTSRPAVFSPLTEAEEDAYLQLPEDTLEAAQKLLRQIGINEDDSTQSIAESISNYVQQSAQYDTATGAMPEDAEDFALWFLTESDTGYCVHFASATAVLLRAAGIPARYVTGYMTRVTPDQECIVTAEQAHAWVEYLHPKFGWTMLESTPTTPGAPIIVPTDPTDPTETTQTTETTEPTQPTETIQPTETTEPTLTSPTLPSETTRPTLPNEGTVPTDTIISTESVGTTAPGQAEATTPTQTVPFYEQLNLKWIRGILWVLAVWMLLAGQYKLRLRLRKKRLSQGSPNEQAMRRWHHVRRLSRLSGYSAKDLLPLAEKAAFSPHQLTQEELAEFDRWFVDANQALLQRPWLLQFLLRILFAIE